MSTDDVLAAAFDESPQQETTSEVDNIDPSEETEATTEEVETTEVEETETVEAEQTEDEPTEENESSLSPTVQQIVDNFETLSDDEKMAKLDKLESSNRSDQLEAAETLRDVYGLEKSEPTLDSTLVDEAVARKLAELGVDAETIKTTQQRTINLERDSYIKEWAKVNDADSQKVVSNKDFLKVYHSADLRDLPLKQRTRMALFEAYGNSGAMIKANKQKAIARSTSMPSTGDSPQDKKENDNLFDKSNSNQPLDALFK